MKRCAASIQIDPRVDIEGTLTAAGVTVIGPNRSLDSVTLRPLSVDSHLKQYHLSFVSLSLNEKGQARSTSLIQRQ